MKPVGVNDVNGMSLSLLNEEHFTDKFIICLCNSIVFHGIKLEFINNTAANQINDFRKFQIKVPTNKQIKEFNEKFDQCFDIKERQFAEELTESEAITLLKPIENEIDKLVEKLYGIED